MAFGRSKPTPEVPSSGLKDEVRTFLKECSSHLLVRGELLSIEAKEAADVYRRKLIFSGLGVGGLLIGYLLFITAFIGIIGSLLSEGGLSLTNWIGATLILGLTHVVLGILALCKAKKSGSSKSLFGYTRSELKKDQQWLNREKNS